MTPTASRASATRQPAPKALPPTRQRDPALRPPSADGVAARLPPDVSRMPVHPENAPTAAWPALIQRCRIGSSCDCPPEEKLAGIERDLRRATADGGPPLPSTALPLPRTIQPKLVVGRVDDPLEHEATASQAR